MSTQPVYQAVDLGSSLACSMTLRRAGDGGVSAVDFELRNPSDDFDVVLKVNREMSAFIMLTVTDDQGTILSKPARKFDTSESQQFDLVRIGRGSAHLWSVPLADQLEPDRLPEQGMTGRLVANLALLYSQTSGKQQPGNDDFVLSVLTLYDMEVLFTRAALKR